MDQGSADNSNWLLDYGISDFPAPPASSGWPSQVAITFSSNVRSELHPLLPRVKKNQNAAVECSLADLDSLMEVASPKRLKSESCSASSSKACREKLRRDRLNDRFLELATILDAGRAPKTDKAAILSDAVRTVIQLRSEAEKLKESNKELQEKIKELKAEKNELRDEKLKLQADKEMIEQQIKAMSARPGFLPHPPAMPAAFAAQGQGAGNKLVPLYGFPGVAMWQFMPPAAVDTSQDHILRPPAA